MQGAMRYLERAAQAMTVNAKREEKRDARRMFLLGRRLLQMLANDPAIRERMAVEMNSYCTRAVDRQLFELDDESTWFDRLGSDSKVSEAVMPKATVPASAAKLPSAHVPSAQAAHVPRAAKAEGGRPEGLKDPQKTESPKSSPEPKAASAAGANA